MNQPAKKSDKSRQTSPRNTQTEKEIHQKKVDASLNRSIEEGTLNASSQSIFSTYLVPLALELGANNFQVGMIETAQQIATTAGQIPGAKMTAYYSRKSIWLFSQLTGRVFLWIPIILLPFLHFSDPVSIIILLAALSAFFLAIRAPAWSSLMGDLVPLQKRGTYFGRRNTITGLAGVAATLITGLLVVALGFSMIFLIGLVLTLMSIPIFMRMFEPKSQKVYHYRHSFALHPREWAASIRVNMGLAIFTLYMLFFNFAMEITAPFYVVYMLKDLGLGYEIFALMIVIGAVVRIFSYKYWGYFNDKFGSRKILIVTGFFACFIPLGWMLSTNVWHVLIIKILDGFIFAGFDQVVFNYLLDVTPANKRAEYVANNNFLVGIGVIFGALIGGILAQTLHGTTFFWLVGLQILFLIGFLLRLVSLVLLPKIREIDVKQTAVMPVKYVFWKTMAVEPATGIRNALQFTFHYSFDRDAEYVKNVKKLRQREALIRKKKEIIEGTEAALGNKKLEDNKKKQ
jgi:MFS family permease